MRVPELILSPLRYLRHLPDRALHGARRRSARARLSRCEELRQVLFVCHGNINRSAYAAAAFERLIPEAWRDRVRVQSAGFIGPGRPASELAHAVGSSRGVDLRAHQSRLLDDVDLQSMQLIVVMNVHQRDEIHRMARVPTDRILILGDLDPQPIARRTIQDPYGHPVEIFERVFDRIDRCLAELVDALPRPSA